MQKNMGKYRWTICALLFFATTINYLDRQVISLLKPYLEVQFKWTESDYSYIVMAFQLSYALGMIFVGRFIDKVGTKLGYALSTLAWSLAAMGHALAQSTLGFGIARSALGISEAGNFPAAIKTVSEWFPKKERAYATGIFNSGSNIGAIVAPLTVPWIAEKMGWDWAFILTGAVGFIWLILWIFIYEIPAKNKRLSKEEFAYINSDLDEPVDTQEKPPRTSWFKLLGFRQAWAFVIGKFLTDPIWWFYLFWLPAFLDAQYGVTGTAIGLPIALVYTMTTFGSIFGGWLPMYFIRKGWPVFKARKTSMLIYAFCVVPVIFAQWLGSLNMWLAVFIIGFAASAHQAWSANIFTTVSDMFPKKTVASVTGLGGMSGSVGGILIAWLAGILFDKYKLLGNIETGYYIMFFICGFAYLIAWVVMHLLVPKMKMVDV
ncbi:MFS transporter [Ginsengibacter hankyongi]|uniref:MFS transporter n=1 Tax=Ginsengibacter hankyongi TaxID=2607284 RepID=A0A5J5IHE2_9BACT|nr:MFS transporter [Ginsengibacter hankyongi]KAA9038071.1 MFS transporter [Ginsengibacter hankyongi]